MTLPVDRRSDRQLRVARIITAETADALAVPSPPPPGADRGPSSPRWHDQSLAAGAAGIAILHGVRAQDRHGSWDPVHAWLAHATREDLSGGASAGLWFGAPAIAYAISTAAPGQYPQAMSSLDAALTQLVNRRLEAASARMASAVRPTLSEFDLVRGLTGLGAYLLHRDPGGELVRRVLNYLVRLTEPVPAHDPAGPTAPGWWTSDPPADQPAFAYPGGHTDLGMAHGIAGPLALLAAAMRRQVTVDGHAKAIERICGWLDAWRHDGPAGPWWPERVGLTELHAGRVIHQTGPARPSWCYGTPGLARAQQLAASALGDLARQQQAEQALIRCLEDLTQLGRLIDPGLCHGWAGLIATVFSAAADSRSHELAADLPRLLDLLYAERARAGDRPQWRRPGLIDGNAGLALTLHTVANTSVCAWRRLLMLT